MPLPPTFRPRPAVRALVAMLALAAFAAGAAPASAQIVQPWSPPGDPLAPLASGARVRFQKQVGDSVAGDNYEGYSVVGDLGRRVFASLGKAHLMQAGAAQATLDSLGLDVEILTDPSAPVAVFMLVRNPFRPTSNTVGFIYWLRGDELHMQGASFPPCRKPAMRAWFTGRQDYPYEIAVTYENLHRESRTDMSLFRMDPEGNLWSLVQYAGHGPEMEAGAHVAFADANLDGLPELLAFQPSVADSYFVVRSGAPPVTEELLYTERQEGFVLHDIRPVPGPTQTLRMLTELLAAKQYPLARRLLLHPAALDTVLKLGWGRHLERGAFTVEYGEQFEAWPEWLELRVHQDSGIQRWIVHFWIQDGRWIVKNWIPVKPGGHEHDVVPLRPKSPPSLPAPPVAAPPKEGGK